MSRWEEINFLFRNRWTVFRDCYRRHGSIRGCKPLNRDDVYICIFSGSNTLTATLYYHSVLRRPPHVSDFITLVMEFIGGTRIIVLSRVFVIFWFCRILHFFATTTFLFERILFPTGNAKSNFSEDKNNMANVPPQDEIATLSQTKRTNEIMNHAE